MPTSTSGQPMKVPSLHTQQSASAAKGLDQPAIRTAVTTKHRRPGIIARDQALRCLYRRISRTVKPNEDGPEKAKAAVVAQRFLVTHRGSDARRPVFRALAVAGPCPRFALSFRGWHPGRTRPDFAQTRNEPRGQSPTRLAGAASNLRASTATRRAYSFLAKRITPYASPPHQ
jgi:hypothetical protein